MKKIFALLLAFVMVFTLAACNTTDSGSDDPTDAPTDPNGTEAPTDAPTEPPTEAPTEAPTDAPVTFTATPVKDTRDAFITKIIAYTQSNAASSSESSGGSVDEEDPNGNASGGSQTDIWHIVTFKEGHELNLFLHDANDLTAKNEEWATIEKKSDETTGDVTYTVKLNYELLCDSFATAAAMAKEDAYRLPTFFGIESSEVNFSLVATTTAKTKKVTVLTDDDLTQQMNGEYKHITAQRTTNKGGTCSITVKIQKQADGQYLYHSEFSFKYSP